ncbi:hypothetical protein ACOMHN_062063 [Nucella lapillus]
MCGKVRDEQCSPVGTTGCRVLSQPCPRGDHRLPCAVPALPSWGPQAAVCCPSPALVGTTGCRVLSQPCPRGDHRLPCAVPALPSWGPQAAVCCPSPALAALSAGKPCHGCTDHGTWRFAEV